MPKGTSCHKTIMTMIERAVHVVYITIYSISLNLCTWKLNYTSCARAVGSFFMVVVGPPWLNNDKKLKKKQHWLKHPKAVPKITKFGPKYK